MNIISKLVLVKNLYSLARKGLGRLLKLVDGKKRYLSVAAFVLLQVGRVFEGTEQQIYGSWLEGAQDVLVNMGGDATLVGQSVYGFILIALFDALRKWAIEDEILDVSSEDKKE